MKNRQWKMRKPQRNQSIILKGRLENCSTGNGLLSESKGVKIVIASRSDQFLAVFVILVYKFLFNAGFSN
jgi:hypothetical protein